MIDLTPLEVRKKKGDFRKALRGYEPALVDDFLDIVADRLDDLVRENTTLKERTTRAESQLAEHREREKALTDALVTAQEMREGVRAQAVAEAEKTTRSAKQEAERLLASATRDAEETLRSANNEAEQTLKAAEQEATQMRSQALHAMRREEEALTRLRARQQQLVQSYRTFLAREMEELQAMADTLESEQAGGTSASTGSRSAASAGDETPVKKKGSAARADTANAPAFPGSSAGSASTKTGPLMEPPAIPFESGLTVMGAVEIEPLPEPVPDPFVEPFAEAPEEPFAPEPVEDWEEYTGPAAPRSAAARAAAAGRAAARDDDELVDMDEVDLRMAGEIARLADDPLAADELALHDGISHDEIEYAEIAYDGIADQDPAGELPGLTADPYGAAAYGQESEGLVSFRGSDDLEPEEELGAPDHDAEALLENALKAGYRLGLDDEDEDGELLLDEAADETDDGGPPKGWLDSIIDDEER